ncbi:hypothetical protein RF11_08298 [Thelohanellus kitauei]|uniref:Uncharacterized protein n=1 Tax=Thelohanellus kitauei TaxID=669202 RepID=A0A0C2IBE9_THEKT|nr:hypothetical protein RF11_08298 [Thelohanellus kitauei]
MDTRSSLSFRDSRIVHPNDILKSTTQHIRVRYLPKYQSAVISKLYIKDDRLYSHEKPGRFLIIFPNKMRHKIKLTYHVEDTAHVGAEKQQNLFVGHQRIHKNFSDMQHEQTPQKRSYAPASALRANIPLSGMAI